MGELEKCGTGAVLTVATSGGTGRFPALTAVNHDAHQTPRRQPAGLHSNQPASQVHHPAVGARPSGRRNVHPQRPSQSNGGFVGDRSGSEEEPRIGPHFSEAFRECFLAAHDHPLVVVPAGPEASGVGTGVAEPGKGRREERGDRVGAGAGKLGDELEIRAVLLGRVVNDVIAVLIGRGRLEGGAVECGDELVGLGLQALFFPF